MNFQQHGYDIAKGTIGTNWMSFTEIYAKEILEEGNWKTYTEALNDKDNFLEILDDYCNGWDETCQWKYEIGTLLPQTIIDNEINEKWQDAKMKWFMGYISYAQKFIKNLAKNEKNK